MQRVFEDDRQYRRVVLGLTMAEIMLLLIFLLLLLLAMRLSEERDRRIAAEATLAKILPVIQMFDGDKQKTLDFFKDYAAVKERAQQLQSDVDRAQSYLALIEEMKNLDPTLTDDAARAKLDEEIAAGATLMTVAGSQDPQAFMVELEKAKARLDALGPNPEDQIASASKCNIERQACENKMDSAKVKPGDPPVCWKDANGKSQAIFTATLKPDGVYLEDLKTPGREGDQAKLPLSGFKFGQAMNPPTFHTAGRDVLALSKEAYCRYLVRLVRDPSLVDVSLYESLRGTVEDIFYIDLVGGR
jgi:hypothetical protein